MCDCIVSCSERFAVQLSHIQIPSLLEAPQPSIGYLQFTVLGFPEQCINICKNETRFIANDIPSDELNRSVLIYYSSD